MRRRSRVLKVTSRLPSGEGRLSQLTSMLVASSMHTGIPVNSWPTYDQFNLVLLSALGDDLVNLLVAF